MSESIPPTVAFPVIEMLAGDEANLALVRAVLAKKMRDVDAYIASHDIEWRIAQRSVQGVLVMSVVILSATPKPPPPPKPEPKE